MTHSQNLLPPKAKGSVFSAADLGSEVKGQRDSVPCVADSGATSKTAEITPRWKAIVFYRTASGTVMASVEIEELSDLHDFVEAGPHWDTIEGIEISRINHIDSPTLTVEEAEKL